MRHGTRGERYEMRNEQRPLGLDRSGGRRRGARCRVDLRCVVRLRRLPAVVLRVHVLSILVPSPAAFRPPKHLPAASPPIIPACFMSYPVAAPSSTKGEKNARKTRGGDQKQALARHFTPRCFQLCEVYICIRETSLRSNPRVCGTRLNLRTSRK